MQRPYVSRNAHESISASLFLLPLIIVFCVFVIYSFYFLVKTSFQFEDLSFSHSQYVGWENYLLVLTDRNYFHSICNNLIFSAAAIAISVSFGFMITVFLSMRFKGSRIFHALFFIPSIMPMALIATVFSIMLEYRFGALNVFLNWAGLGSLAQQWLGDPTWAYISVIGVGIYLIGIPMMYYSADLTMLNTGVLEAAVIDGAGFNRILWLIIFPLLKNAHKTVVLSLLLASFREFERVFLMTGGGPARTTEISSVYLYGFINSAGANIGYMIRNFFDNLPDELMESAHMDGANKYRIFSNIYLPLSLPALVNLGVLSIMWSFQDFLLPTMFLTNKSLTTATLAVNSFKGAFGGFNPEDQGRFYAALVMLGLPAFVIFIFAQKFIRNGVTSGALKE